MNFIRSTSLRRILAILCILASMTAWQASSTDVAAADHEHGETFQQADHLASQQSVQDHGQQSERGDHHCPSCGVHFVAITQGLFPFVAISPDSYQKTVANSSVLRADAPPTPPPNS